MGTEPDERLGPAHAGVPAPDALTRERLGREMQERDEPTIDEPLDPRMAELLRALDQARRAAG